MDAFELNKIFGALTGALVVFLGVSFVTEGIYHTGGHGGGHGHEKLAYSLEIEEADGHGDQKEVVEEISLAALLSEADVAKGEKVFKKCSACHNVEVGGGNKTGPALYGVMGRDIASMDFGYSAVLADMDGGWGWEEMNGFLTKPKEWADGTKMNFAGLKKSEDRANLMAYLNAQSEAPIALPAE
ncbi:MAG: cytochrome c family protein [Rhodobacteraceae bacterium]|nr:cytochrome c family protein [Paracoccaceae bacterium]